MSFRTKVSLQELRHGTKWLDTSRLMKLVSELGKPP